MILNHRILSYHSFLYEVAMHAPSKNIRQYKGNLFANVSVSPLEEDLMAESTHKLLIIIFTFVL